MLGFSTMGITFIMGGYLMLGAVIFSGLEGGHIIIISSYHPHDHDHNHDDFMIGGVGRMPSSQAAHGRNSPTVMNSTTLLGTLPSEVIIIITMIIVTIMMTVVMTMMTTLLGTLPQGKRMMRMRNMMIMNITMMIKMIIMIMNHGYRHHHQNHHHHDNR